MNELLRSQLLDPSILECARAGIDRQRQIQRHLRLPLEVCDLLQPSVLENLEVILRQLAHDGARLVRDIHENVDELDVEPKRLVLLRDNSRTQHGGKQYEN